MAKVQITETILRDAHQSQAATRMRTDEMLPVADKLEKVGAWSLDAGGGVSSFTAGNVTIRRSGQADQRRREALALMGPYLAPSGFHFRGVPG